MSADNWAMCPRCEVLRRQKLVQMKGDLDLAYGNVLLSEFDDQRRIYELEKNAVPAPTFREDYEFYGAEEGVVHASYSGGCKECGLSLKFDHSVPLDVVS